MRSVVSDAVTAADDSPVRPGHRANSRAFVGPAEKSTQRTPWRAPTGYLRTGGLVVFILGSGTLSRAWLAPPASAAAYAWYWIGLALCYFGVLTIALLGRQRAGYHVLGLGLLGAVTFLPYYLRSPGVPIFQDELLHVQSLQLMHELGTTRIPMTFFQIPGDFPGLELTALALMYTTGLPLEHVVRLVPLLTHTAIPMVAYHVMRSCKLGRHMAFFGALVYIANSQFSFFHSTFSYESSAVLFFLVTVMLATRLAERDRGGRVGTTALLLLTLIAVVLTHHVSGALAVVVVGLLAVAWRLVVPRRRSPLLDSAVFGAVVWCAWLVYQTARTVPYLGSNFTGRLTVILTLLQGQRSETRALFWNSPLPVAEHAIAYLYPLILLALIGLGLYRVYGQWRMPGRVQLSTVQVALAVIGPLTWLATAPLAVTRASDVVYRSWAFVLVGVAFYGAVGVAPWIKSPTSLWPRVVGVYSILGLLLAGGIIVGDNQAGRFRPSHIHSAAGPEDFTSDLIDASRWLEADAGRYNSVIGDAASTLGFAAFGKQRTTAWANWLPFYAEDPSQAQQYLDQIGGRFVAVDLRDTRYYPRYQFYFNAAEFFDPIFLDVSHEDVLPLQLLTKFDRMPLLQRIYDNGDIIIYRNTSESIVCPEAPC